MKYHVTVANTAQSGGNSIKHIFLRDPRKKWWHSWIQIHDGTGRLNLASLLALLLILTSSCSSPRSAWDNASAQKVNRETQAAAAFESATKADTLEAYETFLRQYRNVTNLSLLAKEAAAYHRALKTNTVEALSAFLKAYPAGTHAKPARDILDNAFQKAQSAKRLPVWFAIRVGPGVFQSDTLDDDDKSKVADTMRYKAAMVVSAIWQVGLGCVLEGDMKGVINRGHHFSGIPKRGNGSLPSDANHDTYIWIELHVTPAGIRYSDDKVYYRHYALRGEISMESADAPSFRRKFDHPHSIEPGRHAVFSHYAFNGEPQRFANHDISIHAGDSFSQAALALLGDIYGSRGLDAVRSLRSRIGCCIGLESSDFQFLDDLSSKPSTLVRPSSDL